MPRTTLNLDTSVLKELKRVARREGKTIGRVASELLASVLREREGRSREPAFEWKAQPMGARVDLEDKDAVYRTLDER